MAQNDNELREFIKLVFTEDKGSQPSFMDSKVDAVMKRFTAYKDKAVEEAVKEQVRQARLEELGNVYPLMEEDMRIWTDASGQPLRVSERIAQLEQEEK